MKRARAHAHAVDGVGPETISASVYAGEGDVECCVAIKKRKKKKKPLSFDTGGFRSDIL